MSEAPPTGPAPRATPAFLPAFARAFAVLFGQQLRRARRQRSLLYATLVALLPVVLSALILWLAREVERSGPPVLPMVWYLQLKLIVPLTALLLGAGVVADEVDDRTITYPFVRPFPRSALLLGRWAASAVYLSGLLLASSAGVVAVLGRIAPDDPSRALPDGMAGRILAVGVIGGLVYSGVFAALGTFLRHPILVGAGYVFAFEVLLSELPGESQTLTLQYYLKSFLIHGEEGARRLVETVPEAPTAVELVSGPEALKTLAWILAWALAIGSLVSSRRQYVLPS